MNLAFYRCYSCKRLNEVKIMLKEVGCVCGSRKFQPSRATFFDMLFFIVKNPSYLLRALAGEQ